MGEPNRQQPNIKFTAKMARQIFVELSKAKYYDTPYDDYGLQWDNDALWQLLITNLDMPIVLSVNDFKGVLKDFYESFEKDKLMPTFNYDRDTLGLMESVFTSHRASVVDYITRDPPILALGYHGSESNMGPGSSKTGPGSSYTGPGQGFQLLQQPQPFQSIPSSYVEHQIYGLVDGNFIRSLKEIRGQLSQEEYKWARLHMTKYGGRIALFMSSDVAERIELIKDGCAEYIDEMLIRRVGVVPESPRE